CSRRISPATKKPKKISGSISVSPHLGVDKFTFELSLEVQRVFSVLVKLLLHLQKVPLGFFDSPETPKILHCKECQCGGKDRYQKPHDRRIDGLLDTKSHEIEVIATRDCFIFLLCFCRQYLFDDHDGIILTFHLKVQVGNFLGQCPN